MLLSSLVLASAASAETRTPDTIEVIGRKPEEVRKEAQAFVRTLGVAERPVARFVDPVCPKAVGVSKEIAARVEARVRAVAKTVGARLAPVRCRANLMVAFAAGTGRVIDTISARMPGRTDAIRVGVWDKLKASPAPIRWWHVTAERTGDGMRPGGNDVPPAMAGMASSNAPQLGGQVFQQYRSSFLSTQIIRALAASSVIIDVDRANGQPLDSVADYAALVGLAEVQFGEGPPPNSLLNLFAPDGPRDLTSLDLNFLRTLYKLPLDRTAITHRGLLVRGLVNAAADKGQD